MLNSKLYESENNRILIKNWHLKTIPDIKQVLYLTKKLNISPIIAKILLQRNIDTFEKAKHFFRPNLDSLYNPFLLSGMSKAIVRILTALINKEKILIYGDYDVDGTTGVSMLYNFFRNIDPSVKYYIPDRYKEGYGVSITGIDVAKQSDINLIITVDCGIRALNQVDLANKSSIDVIICDHHQPGEVLPNAYSILNPKKKECQYPFDGLSGCGVGFKLLQGLYESVKQITKLDSYISCELKEFLWENKKKIEKLNFVNPKIFLDLVSISIAADIVPIVDENRILMYHGLKILSSYLENDKSHIFDKNYTYNNENKIELDESTKSNYGIKALIRHLDYKDINVSKIVFGLAPRINAAGRISHAHDAVKLLSLRSIEESNLLIKNIENNNIERKELDSQICSEACQIIESSKNLVDAKTTVLYNSNWHKGVIGIVASRCIEKFYRPTIILSGPANNIVGSARSVPGFDIYKAIESCSDLLDKFGGHMYAAGLSLKIENLEKFKKKFEEVVSESITPELLTPKQNIDLEISLDEINSKVYKILNQLAPFGPKNMSPVFCSKNLHAKNIRVLKDNHLKFKVSQRGNINEFEVIGFNMASKIDLIDNNKPFDLAYKINLNNFNGRSNLQLEVKDIK